MPSKKPKPLHFELFKIKTHSHSYGSIPCKDGSFCPTTFTCCVLVDGTYGCCPLQNAVCCNDHLHCCPQNTQCNLKSQCCDAENYQVPWSQKLTQRQLIQQNEDLNILQQAQVCQDEETSCPPMSTCCLMVHGSYACCPHDDGVCCGTHCCAKNSKCGQEIGECIEEEKEEDDDELTVKVVNWYTVEVMAYEKNGLKETFKYTGPFCPGGEVQCANGTCCEVQADSSYVCCPYQSGTCCGVHGYCCPSGYDCDAKLEACTLREDDLKTVLSDIESINCVEDSSRFKCPNTYSCCPNDGSFECCPIPKSVCCEDSKFCCPENFKCETIGEFNKTMCIQDDIFFDAVRKVPSF
jgi:hypothetical protein